jgi:GH24 family phage-related lysozyme (muramidase)
MVEVDTDISFLTDDPIQTAIHATGGNKVDDLFNAAGKALRWYPETPIQKAVALAPPPQTGVDALANAVANYQDRDLTGDSIQTAIDATSSSLGDKMPKRTEVVDNEFLEAVARSENEPLYEQWLEDQEAEVKPFAATGDAKGRSEIGFGYTFKTGTPSGIKTTGDAFENLRGRYSKLINKIAGKSTRFSNIKELPAKYQRVLLSIADNVGITGLDDFKKLQEAMKQHDVEEIRNQMVPKAKLGGDKKYTSLLSRRDNIFYGSGF